jgi:hypothetical protein
LGESGITGTRQLVAQIGERGRRLASAIEKGVALPGLDDGESNMTRGPRAYLLRGLIWLLAGIPLSIFLFALSITTQHPKLVQQKAFEIQRLKDVGASDELIRQVQNDNRPIQELPLGLAGTRPRGKLRIIPVGVTPGVDRWRACCRVPSKATRACANLFRSSGVLPLSASFSLKVHRLLRRKHLHKRVELGHVPRLRLAAGVGRDERSGIGGRCPRLFLAVGTHPKLRWESHRGNHRGNEPRDPEAGTSRPCGLTGASTAFSALSTPPGAASAWLA